MTSGSRTETSRPLFARILTRASAVDDRKGGHELRRRLLAGLEGQVVEIGAGTGNNFAHYPPTVTQVLAIEPETTLRAMAFEAARQAPIPVHVAAALVDHLPVGDASMDAAVVSGVLCSVPNPDEALTELARVLRTGGELRFYEHIRARNPIGATAQRLLDATFWPRLMGGCHSNRRTDETITTAGFQIEDCDRFTRWVTLLAIPVAPRILGRAQRS